MVFGKILKGYSSVLLSVLTFTAIAVMCMAAAFAVTFPLWKMATVNKSLYTILSLTVFISGITFILVRRILKAYKKSPRRLLFSLLKKITVFGGLSVSVYFVFSFQKAAAIVVFISVLIIYGFLAFVLPQSKDKQE